MAQEVVPESRHGSSTPREHVTELKQVFDGILKYLGQIDTSLRQTSPTDKTGEKSDNTGVKAEQLKELSDSVRAWDMKKALCMIDEQPQLMLETFTWSKNKYLAGNVCTVFQLALLLNSDVLVAKMLGIAIREYGRRPPQILKAFKVMSFFDGGDVEHDVEMRPLDIARLRGNDHLEDLLRDADLGRPADYEPEDVESIDYSPIKMYGKDDILALLCRILNSDLKAFLQGDSRAKDLAEQRGTNKTGTVRDILLESSYDYGRQSSLWWGAPYGISLGDEDDFFVLHRYAATEVSDLDGGVLDEVVKKICEALGPSYTTRLLNLTDHEGQTPMHICVIRCMDQSRHMIKFIRLMKAYCHPGYNVLDVRDLAGRTCLHIAVALGYEKRVKMMAETDVDGFRRTVDTTCGPHKSITALHLAAIHDHLDCVKILMNHGCNINAGCEDLCVTVDNTPYNKLNIGGAFQLAALRGHIPMLRTLLQDDTLWDRGMIHAAAILRSRFHEFPALHLAAHSGNPLAVKFLLDSEKFDPFAVDVYGDTALHFAAQWDKVQLIMDCSYFVGKFRLYHNFSTKKVGSHDDEQKQNLGPIIGCMDLLMQTGLDMDEQNKHGETPQLRNSAPDELMRWWYDKLVRQTQEAKSNLVAAANAISVTAALVATASFVGPLQPPLGLSPSGNAGLTGYLQVSDTAVQVFFVCDNLSFYLAIASIMLAVIPSLTIPREGVPLEVRIANRVVQVSVILLFASITFVICAFSAASIAVVPESRWEYKILAVATTVVGALICLSALCLFLLRCMRLTIPRAKWSINLTNSLFPSNMLKKIKQSLLDSKRRYE